MSVSVQQPDFAANNTTGQTQTGTDAGHRQGTPRGGWFRDWGNLLILGLGIWVLGFLLWEFLAPGSGPGWAPLVDLGFQPVNLAAVVLAWRAARHPALDRRLRRAWAIVGSAFLLFSVGDAIWLHHDRAGVDPFPSWADPFYLLFYPVLLWGLLTFPAGIRSRAATVRFWLDAGTVTLGGWMVVWHFALGPAAVARVGDLPSALALAYPLLDLVLLLGATMMLLGQGDAEPGPQTAILALGTFFFIFSDLSFAHLEDQGLYTAGSWPDRLWLVAQFLMALSGQYQCWQAGRGIADQQAAVRRRQPLQWLLYVTSALGYGLLLLVWLQETPADLRVLVYGGVGLSALVVARQVVTIRENERLTAENAARRVEARFASLVQNSTDVITIVDADLTVVYQSPCVERIFGYRPTELIGRKLTALLHPDEAPQAVAFLNEMASHAGAHKWAQWRWFHQDGSWRHTETTVSNLLQDDNLGGLVLNTRDVTERKALEDQLRHQAFHDALTGLANRALFRDRVQQALLDQRRQGEFTAVLYLDLDDFKTVNDSLGHSLGDQLLCAVAERLLGCVRAEDTVARLGGDEFAVLVKRTDGAASLAVARRISEELRAPVVLQGREVTVSVSLGIALNTLGQERVDELLRNADVAMYKAKTHGHGGFEVFHPAMYAEVRERLDLEIALRQAVEARQFVLYYQPMVALDTGRIVGVEALVRWRHPQRGLVPPGQFIPVAEETGLILPIGRWVLQEACRQARVWQRRFPSDPPLSINVNLSVQQLRGRGLVRQVTEALGASELDPRSLVLEITESILMQGTETFIDNLRRLRQLGVRLAIDDFGTGYSSLSYLRWFPVDVLKIDRSFINGADGDPRESALLSGIITLAQALGVQTVAEGIERSGQLVQLRATRCQLGQGYLFARPEAAAAMERLIEQQSRLAELVLAPGGR